MGPALPVIMAVATVASTAVAVYGAVQAGNARKKAAEYNAQVAQQNAQAAQQQGAAAAQEKQRQLAQKIGSMEVGVGASGVSSDSGSSLDELSTSVQQGTLDQLSTRYNYALRGAGYTDTANLDLMEGQNAQQSGYLNAASTALNGMSGAYRSYNMASYPGYGLG